MRLALCRIHAVAAVILVVVIVVQVFLAGLALAQLGGTGDFATHIAFGYTWVGLASLAVLVTALLARRRRRDVGICAVLFVLYIVQTLLPEARGSLPALAALHPVNALVLFGLSVWYARVAWAGWNGSSAAGSAGA